MVFQTSKKRKNQNILLHGFISMADMMIQKFQNFQVNTKYSHICNIKKAFSCFKLVFYQI